MNTKTNLISDLDELEQSPGFLRSLLPAIPKFLFYSVFGLGLLTLIIQNSQIAARIQSKDVLVETQNGQPITATAVESDFRSDKNVRDFVSEIMPLLLHMSNEKPTELGGGEDKGITANGLSVPIPTVIYAASWALTDDGRLPILNAIVQQFPKNIWRGEQRLLRIYHVDNPVRTDDGKISAYMVATLYTVRDGQPTDPVTFNREIHMIPVAQPRSVLKPTPVTLLLQSVMGRGLMISEIIPRKGE